MRYIGQSFEINVAWGQKFEAAFHRAHRERYGYADTSRPTEIVHLRVRATGVTDKPRITRSSSNRSRKVEPSHTASVYLSERAVSVPVYAREDLSAGAQVSRPGHHHRIQFDDAGSRKPDDLR